MQPVEGPPRARHARVVLTDDAFVFAVQGYGHTGESRPGVYVLDRASEQWFELVEVSTEDATFGHSPDPSEFLLAVGWDYRPLAARESVALPLMTSGSVNLPSSVLSDGITYTFRFNEGLGRAEWMTELHVPRAELLRATTAAAN